MSLKVELTLNIQELSMWLWEKGGLLRAFVQPLIQGRT